MTETMSLRCAGRGVMLAFGLILGYGPVRGGGLVPRERSEKMGFFIFVSRTVIGGSFGVAPPLLRPGA